MLGDELVPSEFLARRVNRYVTSGFMAVRSTVWVPGALGNPWPPVSSYWLTQSAAFGGGTMVNSNPPSLHLLSVFFALNFGSPGAEVHGAESPSACAMAGAAMASKRAASPVSKTKKRLAAELQRMSVDAELLKERRRHLPARVTCVVMDPRNLDPSTRPTVGLSTFGSDSIHFTTRPAESRYSSRTTDH